MNEALALRAACARCEGRDCVRIDGFGDALWAQLRDLGDAQLRLLLPVHTEESVAALRGGTSAALPAVAGEYRLEERAVCFVPRFPWLASTVYTVLVQPTLRESAAVALAAVAPLCNWDRLTLIRVERPAPRAEPRTRVLAVHPSGPALPVNQLKLYVSFSAPMSEGQARRCVRLLRADDGRELEAAFLDTDLELWDRERRRLTVLLDPGRIKRGLVPQQSEGYPLVLGTSVRLVIETAFADEDGCPLVERFARDYAVVEEVRKPIRVADWRCDPPRAGTRAPLEVRFDRALDHALLQHCLRVLDAARCGVPGEQEIAEGETLWRFTPERPWSRGHHVLRVAALLEDLAGNSLARVFDRDLGRSDDEPLDAEFVELPLRAD